MDEGLKKILQMLDEQNKVRGCGKGGCLVGLCRGEQGGACCKTCVAHTFQDVESLAHKVMLAADQRNAENLDLWLSKLIARPDGDAAVKDLVRAIDVDGNTLLHRCAMNQGPDGEKVVDALVKHSAQVNATNLLGETPLLAAARAKPSEALLLALLDAKADPSHADTISLETALMELACKAGTHAILHAISSSLSALGSIFSCCPFLFLYSNGEFAPGRCGAVPSAAGARCGPRGTEPPGSDGRGPRH